LVAEGIQTIVIEVSGYQGGGRCYVI